MMQKVYIALKNFIKKSLEDSLTAYAAQITFYMILSFFPFMVLLIMLTSKLSFINTNIVSYLLDMAPEQFGTYIMYLVDDIVYSNSQSFTAVTILVSLWSAAKGIQALTYGLNKIYDIKENKNYFLRRLISAIYTLVLMLVCTLFMLVQIFGSRIINKMISDDSNYTEIGVFIYCFKGIFAFLILFTVILLLYCQLPGRKPVVRDEIIGAILATLGWIFMTKGFSFYIKYISRSSYMYGSLTTVILIVIWLYIGMQIILYGAEINNYIKNNVKLVQETKEK